MKRLLRWTIRLIGIACTLAVGWWVLQTWYLPGIVQKKISAALVNAGINNVRFKVDAVGFNQARLSQIIMEGVEGVEGVEGMEGEPRVGVGQLIVDYQPRRVLKGQVERITVIGAEVDLRMENGKPVLKLPRSSTSQLSPSASPSVTTSPTVSPITLSSLPVEQVDLRGCQVRLIQSDTTTMIPLDGSLGWRGGKSGSGSLWCDVQTVVSGVPVHLTVNTSLALDHFQGTVILNPGNAGNALQWEAQVSGQTTLLNVMVDKPQTWRLPTATVLIGQGKLLAKADWSKGPVQINGDLELAKTSISAGGYEAADITVKWPLGWNSGPLAPGQITIGSVARAGRQWAKLAGSIGLEDKRIWFFAPLQLVDAPTLEVIHPALKDLVFDGKIAVGGEISWQWGPAQPAVAFYVKDAALSSKAYDFELTGLAGSVALTNFSPISSPGDQQFALKSARLGKLQTEGGNVHFRIETPQSILVEKTQWAWSGGTLYSHAFRIDPAKPNADVVVFADGLTMQSMLPLISSNQASGEGTVYGRLPVAVRWPKLTFGNGFLYATPGGGWMKLGQTVAVVGDLMDQSDPRFRQDTNMQQVKMRMLTALQDFQYDLLKVEFVQSDANLKATINVHGKGRSGEKPQEVFLTVNANGLDALLNEVLVMQKMTGGR